MEISYTLLLISHSKYKEARKPKWRGGRGEWHRNILVLQHKLLHIKRGLLEQKQKSKRWILQTCKSLWAISCKAWSSPWELLQSAKLGQKSGLKRASQKRTRVWHGEDVHSVQQHAVTASTTYEEGWHGAQQHLTRPGRRKRKTVDRVQTECDATGLVRWNNLNTLPSYRFSLYFCTGALTIAAIFLKANDSNLSILFSWYNGLMHTHGHHTISTGFSSSCKWFYVLSSARADRVALRLI